jgi:two-component system chemotaxis response regulator CheB
VVILQHRAPEGASYLDKVLARGTPLKVKEAQAGEIPRAGTAYLAPRACHLVIGPAASVFGKRIVAVVLTGRDSDATDGAQTVKAMGGTVIAQDEATSEFFAMPRSAIVSGAVDRVLPLPDIAPALVHLATADVDRGRSDIERREAC